MSQDEFAKLFVYMQKEFKRINEKLDNTATKEDLDRLTNAIDAYAKQTEAYMQEMLALGNKVDRLEQWILKSRKRPALNLQPEKRKLNVPTPLATLLES